MKKARKALLTLCAALLLVTMTVGVTVAYLTAQTEVVTNTFTVGNIQIDLDEADCDLNGVPVAAGTRGNGNEYKLFPGHEYTKDPIVYVLPESEACWVFVKVVNQISDIESTDEGYVNIATQIENNGWDQLVIEGVPVEGVYFYEEIVDATEATANIELPVFGSFKLKGNLTHDDLTANEDDEITIDAYAVQADGFASAAAAWDAAVDAAQGADWAN